MNGVGGHPSEMRYAPHWHEFHGVKRTEDGIIGRLGGY